MPPYLGVRKSGKPNSVEVITAGCVCVCVWRRVIPRFHLITSVCPPWRNVSWTSCSNWSEELVFLGGDDRPRNTHFCVNLRLALQLCHLISQQPITSRQVILVPDWLIETRTQKCCDNPEYQSRRRKMAAIQRVEEAEPQSRSTAARDLG